MPDEVDVPQAELLGEGARQLRLEQPTAGEQRLAESHTADPPSLEGGVQLVVADPALLEQDRAEHRADLVLEVPVVEAMRRGRACGQPEAAADEPLVHAAVHVGEIIGLSRVDDDHPPG